MEVLHKQIPKSSNQRAGVRKALLAFCVLAGSIMTGCLRESPNHNRNTASATEQKQATEPEQKQVAQTEPKPYVSPELARLLKKCNSGSKEVQTIIFDEHTNSFIRTKTGAEIFFDMRSSGTIYVNMRMREVNTLSYIAESGKTIGTLTIPGVSDVKTVDGSTVILLCPKEGDNGPVRIVQTTIENSTTLQQAATNSVPSVVPLPVPVVLTQPSSLAGSLQAFLKADEAYRLELGKFEGLIKTEDKDVLSRRERIIAALMALKQAEEGKLEVEEKPKTNRLQLLLSRSDKAQ